MGLRVPLGPPRSFNARYPSFSAYYVFLWDHVWNFDLIGSFCASILMMDSFTYIECSLCCFSPPETSPISIETLLSNQSTFSRTYFVKKRFYNSTFQKQSPGIILWRRCYKNSKIHRAMNSFFSKVVGLQCASLQKQWTPVQGFSCEFSEIFHINYEQLLLIFVVSQSTTQEPF